MQKIDATLLSSHMRALVKLDSKINLLVHKYELFKMNENESISEMFTSFTDIMNGLKDLGRDVSNVELVNKILHSLL